MPVNDSQLADLINVDVAYPAPEMLDEYRRVDTLNTTQAALRFLRLRKKSEVIKKRGVPALPIVTQEDDEKPLEQTRELNPV